jgi:predicted ATP-grasp superfamily ATP-dependent carboligase
VPEQGTLLIFGASTRAAAFSALRAGLVPWCCDLFGDADLRARCPTMKLPGRYPDGFLGLVDTDLPGPWIYTGGLENKPALIRAMRKKRTLWGNGEASLFFARNPMTWNQALVQASLPAPAVCWDPWEYPLRVRWLVKPLLGTGGAGIHFWKEQRATPSHPHQPLPISYFQEFIEGEPCSALYVGNGKRSRLLGLTQQLIGEPWLHAGAFRYAGSIGPLDADKVRRPDMHKLGDVLVREGGFQGLFGVDGILRVGNFWPVEINPRYTASVEVLEASLGLPAFQLHRLACEARSLPDPPPPPSPLSYVGKAILYARGPLEFPTEGPWCRSLRNPGLDLPDHADIPQPGTPIKPGHPILTVFARGETLASCRALLEEKARDLDRWLFER